MKTILKSLLILSLTLTVIAKPKKGVLIDISLNPAGSFQIKAKVKGSLKKKGDMLVADKLVTKVSTFKTGVDLRDDHTKKKMLYKKFPTVVVTDVKAKNNQGIAKIKIMNKMKEIKFRYKDLDKKYAQAVFKLSLKELGIGGINYMGIGVEDTVKVTATVKKK
ncbi:MAG: hypothetical protein CME69_05290 [Halobacteriovorax sp.]|nr:hypothetical protein [Halobacteriovorax sp.]|tara:strand:+ start:486 stop:974 length:489 start_codon:yes stop_codon:yes gene_type:complete